LSQFSKNHLDENCPLHLDERIQTFFLAEIWMSITWSFLGHQLLVSAVATSLGPNPLIEPRKKGPKIRDDILSHELFGRMTWQMCATLHTSQELMLAFFAGCGLKSFEPQNGPTQHKIHPLHPTSEQAFLLTFNRNFSPPLLGIPAPLP